MRSTEGAKRAGGGPVSMDPGVPLEAAIGSWKRASQMRHANAPPTGAICLGLGWTAPLRWMEVCICRWQHP